MTAEFLENAKFLSDLASSLKKNAAMYMTMKKYIPRKEMQVDSKEGVVMRVKTGKKNLATLIKRDELAQFMLNYNKIVMSLKLKPTTQPKKVRSPKKQHGMKE